jgi:exopolysaccharide biosynthesis protein
VRASALHAASFAALLFLGLLAGCASKPGSPAAPHPSFSHQRVEPWPGAVLHVLWIDLATPGWRLRVSPPEARGLSVDEMAQAKVAAVTVNASFFDRSFVPRGHTVSDGVAWTGVLAAAASPLLACDVAQRCRIEFEPAADRPPADGHNVVAGTPWLVRAGRARVAEDDARCAALCEREHPRTALGLDAERRRLLIVLAEGRRDGVPGVRLAALAEFMRSLGAHDAINLDGGGSSALLIGGESRMARPANEPAQRRIANVLLWMPAAH